MSSEQQSADIRTNILLVDDRPQNLLALGAILEPLGQNIVLAQSGQQALKALLETDFAVILLDVLMPGLDGFETAALIKERAKTRHIPIIFLTAATQTAQTVSRGYTVGAVDYISKPFSPEILRAKVAVFVELYRKNEQIHRQNELLRQNEQRERLREREELRRLGEKRYQSLAESMPQIVFTATPEGRTTYFNRRWYEYTGHAPSPSANEDWMRAIHLDDLSGMEKAWQSAREGAPSFEVAVRFRRASDGAYRWHLVRALASEAGTSGEREWIGTCTEIEDLVRAEKGLRFQADASKLLASSLDWRRTLGGVAELAVPDVADWCTVTLREADGSLRTLAVVHANPEKAALAREIEARYPDSGQGPWSLLRLHAEGRSRLVESVDEGMLPGAARDEEHLRLLREQRLQSWIFVPLFDRGSTIGSIELATAESGRRFRQADVEFAEDLARRVSAAVAIARLYEAAQSERVALEEASRVKDEFLAVLSHELRTPLHAMLGWTQLLRSGKLDAENFAHGLETIERSGKAQARLIGDILDVSRIITGKLRLNLGLADLSVVARAVLDSLRPTAEAKEIRMELRADPSLHPIPGDPERLEQVVWNLVSNSIKFTPRGGSIRVEVSRRDEFLELAVRDDGIGINPEFLPFIFDRFRQADSSTTRSQGGLGLGLSIVRYLVELHGGRVRADSEGLGRGTCMTLELPCPPRRGAVVPVPVEPRAVDGAHRDLEGLTVLVVEDVSDVRTLYKAMLEPAGVRVRTASSAAEALEALRADWPDLLISDIGLPGQNGYDLMRRVRSLETGRPAPIPALALTAYASDADQRKAMEAGFHAHLAKPVERDALLDALARLVAGRRPRASQPAGEPA